MNIVSQRNELYLEHFETELQDAWKEGKIKLRGRGTGQLDVDLRMRASKKDLSIFGRLVKATHSTVAGTN